MCRNIRVLFNFEPPATDEEVRGASLQFVRKISGCHKLSRTNEVAFERAVDENHRRRISEATRAAYARRKALAENRGERLSLGQPEEGSHC